MAIAVMAVMAGSDGRWPWVVKGFEIRDFLWWSRLLAKFCRCRSSEGVQLWENPYGRALIESSTHNRLIIIQDSNLFHPLCCMSDY
jgi:hypothetical protein